MEERAASRPSAADRKRDAAALGILMLGVATFFYARYRMQLLAADQITRVPGHSATEQFWFYDRMSYAGLWIAGAGIVAAVVLSLLRVRRARRAPHTLPES